MWREVGLLGARGLSIGAMVVALNACGGEENSISPDDRLQGIWGVESTEYECVHMFYFEDGFFEMMEVCELDSGRYVAESYFGNYILNEAGTSIVMNVKKSSCADTKRTWSASVGFPADNLRLTTPNGVMLLERVSNQNADTGGAAVEFGCFDEDGYFSPSPVRNL